MQTEIVKLTQLKINEENPRTITTDKFRRLVDSVLVFPKMLGLRPVVVDNTFTVLGGNMRTQALNAIKGMSMEDIEKSLLSLKDYSNMSKDEKEKLLAYWRGWLNEPTTEVVKASILTQSEKKQFIVKDNLSFGAWDFDALANQFDNAQLMEWGMDVWQDMTMDGSGLEDDDKPTETPTAQEDDFDEEKDAIKVVCKPGDIWQLGEHRLMCGDSIKLADVQRLMGGGS